MPKPLTTTQQFWLNHINAAQESALPMSVYAAQHNISVKALYTWKWQFKQQSMSVDQKVNPFVKITQASMSPTKNFTETSVRVTLPNGIGLQLQHLTPDILTLLLRA